ncbi:MAG: TolC family protein [Desulfobacteraceae bacterium]|jgi:allophanate hydrolase subunit 1|nr:MAG: TolC family protein [Desulfobacteraceae bacterium]
MFIKEKIFFSLVIAISILLSGLTTAQAAPVITLERAKTMAREQGNQMKAVEIAFSQAETSLALVRSQYGLGSYYTAEDLKKDMDLVEAIIDERVNAIKLLEESIAEWKEEIAGMEAGGRAAIELQKSIDQAYRDIAEYSRQVDELRPAYASMVLRYHPQKSQEEQAKPQLRPAEASLKAAEDALVTQPKVIDYNVEETYLSLLAVAKQRAHQELVERYMEKALQREKLMLELGRSTPLSLAQAEERLRQVQETSLALKNREENLQRTFRRLLGLPVNFEFDLAEVNLIVPDKTLIVEEKIPDFTYTLTYQRELDTLEQKRKDLEDTSTSDHNNYRSAELAVEEAELNLQNTLTSLTNNYLAKTETLDLVTETLRNAELGLQIARKELEKASLQFMLGIIAALDLEQKELVFEEAELKLFTARQDYHLALQAYYLALEGISPDTASTR